MTGTALLVMDVQEQVVRRYPDPDYLPLLRTALDAARAAGIPVIYVVVDFRPGYPEISARNKMFGGLAARAGASAVSNGIHPEVTPEEGEIVVSKRRVSAFSGSDLELLLRAQDIGHLVLTGIATSGVVLSTLREAADMDYELTVLADGCLDADPEVQRVLTEKVFPMQAGVVSIADWAKNLEG